MKPAKGKGKKFFARAAVPSGEADGDGNHALHELREERASAVKPAPLLKSDTVPEGLGGEGRRAAAGVEARQDDQEAEGSGSQAPPNKEPGALEQRRHDRAPAPVPESPGQGDEEEEGELVVGAEPAPARPRPGFHVDLTGARLGAQHDDDDDAQANVQAEPQAPESELPEPLPLTEANVRELESSRRPLSARFGRSASRGSGDGTPQGPRPSLTNILTKRRSNPSLLRKHMATMFKGGDAEVDAIKLEDLEKKLGVQVTKDPNNQHRNLQKAACFMVDAFHGRLKNGLGSNFDKPFYIRTAFRVHMKPGFKTSLKIEALLLCLLVFWEPASFKLADETGATQTLICKIVEFVILMLLFSDYMLRLVYMGIKGVNEKYFIRLLMWVEVVCLVDVIISFGLGSNAVRFSRPLRPMVFALVDKSTLNLCTQCLSAERKLRPLAVLLLFCVCVCSVLVTALCADSVWDEPSKLYDHWDRQWRPYQSFLYSFTPLTSLVTTEGFPDQVLPFAEATPELTIVFYGLIVLGAYTLLNLAIAIQVDEFQRLSKKTTTTEEKKLIKTLTVVFYLARDESTLKLSFEDFKVLMLCYKSRMKLSLINMLFQSVDKDLSGDLDLGEFLDLCDLLRSSEFTNRKNFEVSNLSHMISSTRRSISRQIVRLGSRKSVLSSSRKKGLVAVTDHKAYVVVSSGLVLVNILLLATLNDGDNESAPYTMAVLNLDFFFIFLFFAEFGFLLFLFRWDEMKKHGWNRFHLAACVGTALVFVLYPALDLYLDKRLHIRSRGIAIHKIALTLRAFRALKGSKHFSLYINLIKRIVPILVDFAKALFCFMYFHGVVCMEVLYKTQNYHNAKNMALTEITLLQTDNWQTMLYDVWDEVTTPEKFVATVLITGYIWYICIIVLSQLMATLYDVFKVYRDNLADKTAKKKKSSKGNWRRDMADKDLSKKVKDGIVAKVEGKEDGLEDDDKPDLERKASRESKLSQGSHQSGASKRD